MKEISVSAGAKIDPEAQAGTNSLYLNGEVTSSITSLGLAWNRREGVLEITEIWIQRHKWKKRDPNG